MSKFKRWIPLLGVAYISALTILQAFGLADIARHVATIGGLVGLDRASPVGAPELAAAAAAFSGVVLKVMSVIDAAKRDKA